MKILSEIKKLPLSVKFFSFASALMALSVCKVLSFTWSNRQDYSFGYLTPIFVLYVLWIRKDKIREYFLPKVNCSVSRSNRCVNVGGFEFVCNLFFWAMLACALVVYISSGFMLYITGNLGAPSFAMTMGFVFSIFAMVYLSSATDANGVRKPVSERLLFVSHFVFPCFIWLVAAPMFGVIEELISLKLLSIVAVVDFTIMDTLGYVVKLRGNVIEFPNGSVGVAEACSGIRSLTACIFAGSFLAAAMLDKFWKKLLLVISSMFLAFFFNLCRSMFLALWAYENGAESISGTVHDTAGYVILSFTVVGLLALVSLLNLNPIPEEFREADENKTKEANNN